MTSHSPLLSHSHIRLRALSSPRSPSLIGWGVAGAPPRITIHRFVRSVAGATPQGARCVELRLEPQHFSLTHTYGYALSSPRSPSLLRWGVAGAPPRITIHGFVRSVAGATPQGARCVELRLEPQLEAARSLTSHCSPRLASLASPRSPRLACPRLASLDSPCSPARLGFLLDSPCLARLASPLHSLASPPRSPDLLARLASLRSSAAAPLATLSLASLELPAAAAAASTRPPAFKCPQKAGRR